jgi:hypothetical protein
LFVVVNNNQVPPSPSFSTILQYDATTGALLKPNFGNLSISGNVEIAASSNVLYVESNGVINIYDLAGNLITSNFINLNGITCYGMALNTDQTVLYVSDDTNNRVSAYDAINGTLLNPNITNGLNFAGLYNG